MSSQDDQPLRKTRNKRACDICRFKRNRCSGGQPCDGCRDFGLTCTYDIPQKKRGPAPKKKIAGLPYRLDRIDRLSGLLAPDIPSVSSGSVSGPSSTDSASQEPEDELHSIEAYFITRVRNLTTNSTVYFGPSSTGGACFVQENPRFRSGMISFSLPNVAGGHVNTLPQDQALPFSHHITYSLIGVYFEHIAPYLPLIDKAQFYAELEQPSYSEPFSLLVWTMCTIVSLQTTNMAEWGIHADIYTIRKYLSNHCYDLIARYHDCLELNMIQSLYLWAIICTSPSQTIRPNTHQLLATVRAMVVELGFHLSPKIRGLNLSVTEHRIQNSAFFCMYITERYGSLVTGRHALIQDHMWDMSLLDDHFDHDHYHDLIIHVKLSRIMGDLTDLMNNPNPMSLSAKKQKARAILESLQVWLAGLPIRLRLEPNGRWTFHHHFYLVYNSLNILAQRIAVGIHSASALESAHAIVRCLRRLPRDIMNQPFQSKNMIFFLPATHFFSSTAAILFLDIILEFQRTNPAVTSEIVQAISELNEVLGFLSQYSTALSQWLRGMINDFINWHYVCRRSITDGQIPTSTPFEHSDVSVDIVSSIGFGPTASHAMSVDINTTLEASFGAVTAEVIASTVAGSSPLLPSMIPPLRSSPEGQASNWAQPQASMGFSAAPIQNSTSVFPSDASGASIHPQLGHFTHDTLNSTFAPSLGSLGAGTLPQTGTPIDAGLLGLSSAHLDSMVLTALSGSVGPGSGRQPPNGPPNPNSNPVMNASFDLRSGLDRRLGDLNLNLNLHLNPGLNPGLSFNPDPSAGRDGGGNTDTGVNASTGASRSVGLEATQLAFDEHLVRAFAESSRGPFSYN
ncbi:uncharacterized protein BJ171DRAFT_509406 [Polychytrium aggregatum]|uniref:uncharacterized protein n=1 Tax=Polychytrium aggregatum TaxID=110093 RepID=UPI0022FE4D21|nr:uncharacterized protein BJ171DRAFT_509406 [Polychytrium aggregatum]KAI9203721.1 hypothetical protein BJ171DRAFT_509406 [Polychytrium aggregatum]